MAAIVENLRIEQGVTWSTGWAVEAGDTVDDLAPIDSTWTAQAQIRASRNHGSELRYEFTASVDDDGNVVIGVPHTDSEGWTWKSGVYDVEVTNADESVRLRVAMGSVTVSPDVTADVAP